MFLRIVIRPGDSARCFVATDSLQGVFDYATLGPSGLLPLLGVVAGAATAAAAESTSKDATTTTKAAALVEQLGDDSFEVRKAAYVQLEKMGKTVKPALEEGARARIRK